MVSHCSFWPIGHEIWLGDAKVDDMRAEIVLSYGHNMRRDCR